MPADDLSVGYMVSRDSDHGGPDPLDMNSWSSGDSSGIAIARGGLLVGGKIRRNTSIDSEGTDGAVLLGSTLDMVPAGLVVILFGDPDTREMLRALIANEGESGAFDQFTYTIDVTFNGTVERQYVCWPADVTPGDDGAVNEFAEMADREYLTLKFMRQPHALVGSF